VAVLPLLVYRDKYIEGEGSHIKVFSHVFFLRKVKTA
jgi:hypothetical protein